MTLITIIAAGWLFGPALLFLGLFSLGEWLDRRRRRDDELRLALLRDSMALVWLELPNWLELELTGRQSWELDQALLLPCDADTIPEDER